jgi:hypothetical protein
MDDFDPDKPFEVSVVKRQQMLNFMPIHRGDEACIVRCLAHDIVLNYQLPPTIEDRSLVSKQMEVTDKVGDIAFRLCDGHAKPVVRNRPSGHDPVFVENLRDDTRSESALPSGFDCFLGGGVL